MTRNNPMQYTATPSIHFSLSSRAVPNFIRVYSRSSQIKMCDGSTTRGRILKAEFKWRIETTFKWPRSKNESFDSELFPKNKEDTKWGLKITRDLWEILPTLSVNLCLLESPHPSITARFSISVTDEKQETLLFEKKSGPVPFTIFNGDLTRLAHHGSLLIGNQEDLLEIPSVLIHVIVEYEKETVTTTTLNAALSLSDSTPTVHWSTGFENLFTSETGTDISFMVTGQVIKANKAILSARSPVFAAMFQSDMKEKKMEQIAIPGIDWDIFYALLRYIYCEKLNLTVTNASLLLAAANQYLLPSLKSKCEDFIIENLSTETCVDALMLGDLHSALLKQKAIDMIQSHHKEIWVTEGWKNLEKCNPHVAIDIMKHIFQ